jgi:AcrR family transcriptional regulator
VPNSLYYYFKSKQHLYERVIESIMSVVRDGARVKGQKSPEASLAAIVHQAVELVVRNPVETGILYRHLFHVPGPIGEQARSGRRETILRIRKAIAAGQARGTIKLGNPALLAAMACASIAAPADWLATVDRADVTYGTELTLEMEGLTPEEVIDTIVEFILAGIGVCDPRAAMTEGTDLD